MPRKKAAPTPPPRDSDEELDAILIEHTPDVIDPGYDGHRLRISGLPWAEVATRIGAPSARSAVQSVSSYLQKAAAAQSAQQQQEALQTQIDRYEAVLAAWWLRGTDGGDEKAAGVVLRVLERLDRVQRLTDGDVVVTKETLVVSANPEEYIKQLKEIVSERDAASGK